MTDRKIVQLIPASGHVEIAVEGDSWTVPIVAYALVQWPSDAYGDTETRIDTVIVAGAVPTLLSEYYGEAVGQDTRPALRLSTGQRPFGGSHELDGGQLGGWPVQPLLMTPTNAGKT